MDGIHDNFCFNHYCSKSSLFLSLDIKEMVWSPRVYINELLRILSDDMVFASTLL